MNPKYVDHIVYAVPILENGIEYIHSLLGVKPVIGGQHLGYGTWNALISLGRYAYLEIIAPDPNQPIPEKGRWMGIDNLKKSQIITWAIQSGNLENTQKSALNSGFKLGEILNMKRRKPDGEIIKWKMTKPKPSLGDGLIPFMLDWQDTEHPTKYLPFGGELILLKAGHPNPFNIKKMLKSINIEMDVEFSDKIKLTATIQSKNGIIQLV